MVNARFSKTIIFNTMNLGCPKLYQLLDHKHIKWVTLVIDSGKTQGQIQQMQKKCTGLKVTTSKQCDFCRYKGRGKKFNHNSLNKWSFNKLQQAYMYYCIYYIQKGKWNECAWFVMGAIGFWQVNTTIFAIIR